MRVGVIFRPRAVDAKTFVMPKVCGRAARWRCEVNWAGNAIHVFAYVSVGLYSRCNVNVIPVW
jgi:hypothetical protein